LRRDVTAVIGSSIGIAVLKDEADEFREDVTSAVPESMLTTVARVPAHQVLGA
jgi:hypothetical protein